MLLFVNTEQTHQAKELLHAAEALIQSMETSVQADSASVWRYSSYWEYARKYNQLLEAVARLIPEATVVLDRYDIDKLPSPFDTIALQQKQFFELIHANLSILRVAVLDHLKGADPDSAYEGKDTPPEVSTILKIINLAERSLRKALRSKPEQERDVQDAFDTLLIGAEMSYSRETDRIEYSSKTYAPDFTMPRIGLAVDIKLCNREGREKEIIAEINDDILAYRSKYPNLLFVVYDLGMIRDVDRFKASFEANENVVVIVVKQ